jgi:uncharacterized SAM-binding protein YcdF (DUF218 family)
VYFLLKSALRALLLPPGGLLLLAGWGALVLRRQPRRGAALLVAGLGGLWLLTLPVVADPLTRLVEGYPSLDPTAQLSADAVVILASGGVRSLAPEYAGPAPGGVMYERLAYGAWLAKRTQLPVLVTGHAAEAWAMRDSLARDFGVVPRWVEDRSRDTYENARRSTALLRSAGVRSVLLVTSSTHMARAVHEFNDAGCEVVAAPTGEQGPVTQGLMRFLPSLTALTRSQAALYELAGEAVRRVLAMLRLRERFETS